MRPPTQCPVCHDSSISVVKHLKGPSRKPTAYRCSKGHVFQVIPLLEVRRSKQLQQKARETRQSTEKQMERSRKLRDRRHS